MVAILTPIVLMVVGIPGYTYVYTFYVVWLQKGIGPTVLWSPALHDCTQVVKSLSQLQAGDVRKLFWCQRAPLILMIQCFFSFSFECFFDTESDMIEGPRA